MESMSQRKQYAKGGIGKWYWDYRDDRVLSYIGEENTILDLGCGEGITLDKLRFKFPDRYIVGIDKKEIYHPAVIKGNVYDLNVKNGCFDCCLFLEVIEHLKEPLKALQQVYRILRVGGLLLLVFPNDRNFKIARLVCLKFKEVLAHSGHVKQWNPEEMRQTLKQIGFEIQEEVLMPLGFWLLSLHCLMVARKNG